MERVKLIECPRDAWQGLQKIIPTQAKAAYLRTLIGAGFTHLDAVSFVAPKYVPQMADCEQVLRALSAKDTLAAREDENKPRQPTQVVDLIGIVVNEQGLKRALAAPGVTTLGYPYSVSANFRRQNAHMSQSESRQLADKMERASREAGLELVVYISMAFGNPFSEPWSPEVTAEALDWLKGMGVKAVSLADTAGVAGAKEVGELYRQVRSSAESIELGVHLHSHPAQAAEKVLAAFEAGCRRFDGALTGLGGCPFAGDNLVGNIPTETIVSSIANRGVSTGIDAEALGTAVEATMKLRREYLNA